MEIDVTGAFCIIAKTSCQFQVLIGFLFLLTRKIETNGGKKIDVLKVAKVVV